MERGPLCHDTPKKPPFWSPSIGGNSGGDARGFQRTQKQPHVTFSSFM